VSLHAAAAVAGDPDVERRRLSAPREKDLGRQGPDEAGGAGNAGRRPPHRAGDAIHARRVQVSATRGGGGAGQDGPEEPEREDPESDADRGDDEQRLGEQMPIAPGQGHELSHAFHGGSS
jgi:hypothetical protein